MVKATEPNGEVNNEPETVAEYVTVAPVTTAEGDTDAKVEDVPSVTFSVNPLDADPVKSVPPE
jgi:hypothetical protein